MSAAEQVVVRAFAPADLAGALALWSKTEGIGLNESDTREALERYLARNPGLSAVATTAAGALVGAVLCGHDGRRGSVHHLAVAPAFRRRGIGERLLEHCLARLRDERIPRCNIHVYHDNSEGNAFWRRRGWGKVTTWETLQKRL